MQWIQGEFSSDFSGAFIKSYSSRSVGEWSQSYFLRNLVWKEPLNFQDKSLSWLDRFEIARVKTSKLFADYSIQDVSLNWNACISF